MRGVVSCKPLALRRIGREMGIVFIIVVEEGRDEAPFVVLRVGILFAASQASALQQGVAKVSHRAGFFGGEGAIGEGEGELFEEALDFFGRDEDAGAGFEFAGKIGGAKATVRGVGMGVAEAVAAGMGGLGAAASVEEGKAAEWEIR